MYITDHLQVRISLAQTIDRIFYEPGNARRCHKWVYRHYGRYFLGVSYDTYLSYLQRPAEAKIPGHIVELFEAAKARLDERHRSRGFGRTTSRSAARSGANGGSERELENGGETVDNGRVTGASERPSKAVETVSDKEPVGQY